nr:odorant binding protein 16 [Pagiophloeus tsushimanus]
MKHFIAVLLCALVASALARPEVNQDAVKESGRRIKEAHDKCQTDPATAIDEEALKNARKSGAPPAPPANSGPHSLCISKAVGWQNEDGSINKANIEEKAHAIFGEQSDIKNILDECVVAQENPEATAVHLFDCYRKHAPHPAGGPHPPPPHH